MISTDVAVLGAGPAGLAAAWWAARQGLRVTVLERAERVGGATASIDVAGLRVDLGSHRLHPSIDPPLLAELQALLGNDLQRRTRDGRIRLAGQWLSFPLRPVDVARNLPADIAVGALRDSVTSWTRRPRQDTFAEVVRCGLGPTMLRHFYGPYAQKVWGLAPEQLSGAQARRRIAANSARQIGARLWRAGRGEAPWFWYPRRGFGQIAQALADAAVEAGVDLRLGAAADRIDVGGDHVRVAFGSRDLSAGQVLSTVPLPLLAQLAGAPPSVRQAAQALRFRAMVLVYVVIEQPRYTRYDAHYLPGPQTPLTRLSEPKNYRESTDDPGDVTVLCAELPCQEGDQYWRMDDTALGELVRDGLGAVGLPDVRPAEIHVRRLAHAYPIADLAAETARDQVDQWAAGLAPRVLTFGRQGLFAHDNTHHALAMAAAAVRALAEPQSWARSRAGFARHVVED